MLKNPKVRKVNPDKPKAPTKRFKANMATLEAYSSTSALNQSLMSTVKQFYENRDITNIKTAVVAMDLLKANDFNKFKKKFASIAKLVTTKQAKTAARRETRNAAEQAKMDQTVRGVEREVYKPRLKYFNAGTEAPTYEVQFIKNYTNIGEAWDSGVKKLIQMTEKHMKTKPNIRLALGCKFTAIKTKIDADNEDPDTVEEVADGAPKNVLFQINNIQLYNIESVKASIKNLRGSMESAFHRALDRETGSGWTVKRIDSLFAVTHTLRAAKGGSYLPTPASLAHPNCGVINVSPIRTKGKDTQNHGALKNNR
jgi:hypothetical protein